ncbi:hypothetical protein A3Q56_03460 [Intoshia linei]|uniref:SUEL-type lectin domain-containing protein n=1 Tax=Intoshia linei TaxID=1819745 RepID=A0A177B506_9BILA|nr:hypothetical protein A3Q56_03460 [Intoshia linei]
MTIMKIESCLTETFEAGCSDPSQVILIENAFYGRMKVGRCVRYNFGNIGCFKNVVSQLDSLCSMKNFCSFSTADQILIDTKPCPIDFTPYLYVEYLCISVKKLMTCSNIHVTNKPTFMLYEKTIINEKCNSRFWVDSGKKMNITTYNLNLYKNLQKPHQNANHLKSFQSLENFWNVKNFKNCSDTLNIYNLQNQQNKTTPQKLCISNRTDNIIINGDVTNIAYANKFSYLSETYLIKFEGIGCENYKSPLYSHAVRFNSSTSVTCNTSNVH